MYLGVLKQSVFFFNVAGLHVSVSDILLIKKVDGVFSFALVAFLLWMYRLSVHVLLKQKPWIVDFDKCVVIVGC